MNTKINLQTILIVFILCVTVIVSKNSYADAQVGGENNTHENVAGNEIMFDPVPDGPGFIMVNVFDFQPFHSTDPQAFSGTGLYNPDATLWGDSVTGVTLPHGSTITKVTIYYQDNSSANLSFYFGRGGSANWDNFLTYFQSEGAEPGYRTISQTNITNSLVDNKNFSYYLEVTFPPSTYTDLMLVNVRIDYAYTSYTPLITK